MSRVGPGVAIAAAALSLGHCARPAPPLPDAAPAAVAAQEDAGPSQAGSQAALKTLQIDALGLRLDLPVAWTIAAQDDGHHLQPPAGEPAAQAVWLLQAQRTTKTGGSVDDALALKRTLLDELKQVDPAGKLLRTVAFARDGVQGVRLETLFTREGVLWRKDQLLLDRPDQVLVLSVAAPDASFEAVGQTWSELLASLRFTGAQAP